MRILTMDPAQPQAAAVTVGSDGRIAAVGDLAHCQQALPDAERIDLGSDVLLPGFVESHSHPVISGVATQPQAYWIAPTVGYSSWESVTELFKKVHAERPAGEALLFNGFDKLLNGAAHDQVDGRRPHRPGAGSGVAGRSSSRYAVRHVCVAHVAGGHGPSLSVGAP